MTENPIWLTVAILDFVKSNIKEITDYCSTAYFKLQYSNQSKMATVSHIGLSVIPKNNFLHRNDPTKTFYAYFDQYHL